jgi:hypothetical protein
MMIQTYDTFRSAGRSGYDGDAAPQPLPKLGKMMSEEELEVNRPEGRGGYGGDAPPPLPRDLRLPSRDQTYPASHKKTHLHIEVFART